jgi:two-component system, sensor histidine kinase and response regulator
MNARKQSGRISASPSAPSQDRLCDVSEQPYSDRSSAASGDDAFRQALPPTLLHDLRTPLNQIIGYCEMLTEQAQDDGQTALLPDLQRVGSAGAQLLALINTSFVPLDLLPQASAAESANGLAALPLARPMEQTARRPETTESQLSSRAARGCLLVVDDNEMNRDVLSRRLKRQGHDVVMVGSGREALAAVRERAFDLVLLDIMMPEVDGYEVLRSLKADQDLSHIPVIMISALHELDSVVRCIEMGADDYLFKPFEPTLLKARVGACLEKKHARDRESRLFEQLQENYKRLQELEKQRDDLTHMIIHDLRTPLTSVIAGMLTLDAVGDLNEDQREIMGIAISGGETLMAMINSLLDVEKLEAGSMPLDYTNLSVADLVSSATGQIASLAESTHLNLVHRIAADLPPLRCDRDKLCRTLVNLLGNAIKFTPTGGTVTLDVQYGDKCHSIVFSVSDTGEGIPAESFEHIFEKFGQVETRAAGRTMSSGLGLTFCKLAVEAHGGQISVESTPDKGSKFSFTIPLQPPI